MADRRVTRRDLFRFARGSRRELSGIVQRVRPPSELELRIRDADRESLVVVRVAATSMVAVADLAVGDMVTAAGEWAEDGFEAHSVVSGSRLVEGRILSRTAGRLELRAGPLELTDATQPRAQFSRDGGAPYEAVPLDELVVGDEVAAQAWRDEAGGCFVAVSVGARRPRAELI
jgi:hypothetical protein